MGRSSTSFSRVNSDSPSTSTQPTKNKTPKVQAARSLWVNARSLRPNPEQLALACHEGDEEAMAEVEAWRPHWRCTPYCAATIDHFRFSGFATFEGDGNGWYNGLSQPAKYKDSGERGPKTLWDTACLFAQAWVAEYNQNSIRWDKHDQDLVNDLATHAVQQIEAGKFLGIKKDKNGKVVKDENGNPVIVPFDHWMSTLSYNFTNNSRKKWKREKDELVGVAAGTPAIEENDDDESFSVSHSGKESLRLWLLDSRQQKTMADALKDMTAPDQAYAGFLMQGLNQKQAAVRMEESVVTARKRQERIRTVLEAIRTVSLKPVAEVGH